MLVFLPSRVPELWIDSSDCHHSRNQGDAHNHWSDPVHLKSARIDSAKKLSLEKRPVKFTNLLK